ncbi:MAG: hypothetical protein JNL65_10430, partial [Saprospiraceae bacterium]|nr:hypothetical protein [Saprospiraceae bacterium]
MASVQVTARRKYWHVSGNFMKAYTNYILTILKTVIFCSCGQQNETVDKGQTEKQNSQSDKIENTVSDKKDYELADEFL